MFQRSPEWFAARCGKVTASRLADVMARTKSGYAASRQNYMAELICQRLTGKLEEGFSNAAMMRGTELEPVAREMYALNEFDAEITEVGLIDHPTIPGFAASPDGLVNGDGLIEIKCPNTWTHLETLKTGEPKRQYLLQMHAQMMCTGRKWCDFVSFDDRLPPDLAYFKKRIHFDEVLANEIESEVKKFLEELEKEISSIKTTTMPHEKGRHETRCAMTDYGGSKTPKNERDYWQTPIEIFNALDREFGFWLDAAASESNALCAHYLTELDDSLNSEWASYGSIWCNPPYSDIGPWVEKAAEQSRAQSQAVVMLLPADISTGWFISAMQSADELRLITGGRVQFVPASVTGMRKSNPKGSLLFIWRPYITPRHIITTVSLDELKRIGNLEAA